MTISGCSERLTTHLKVHRFVLMLPNGSVYAIVESKDIIAATRLLAIEIAHCARDICSDISISYSQK